MQHVWLIGAGNIAKDYSSVLQALDVPFTVIGRSETNCRHLSETISHEVISGGIDAFLATDPAPCTHAIVAVGTEALYLATHALLTYGIRNILVEKPGALHNDEFYALDTMAQQCSANLFIGYNRRFYASVLEAEKIIEEDGGVSSFNFEFTEWSHIIETLEKPEGIKEKWFLGNSTHVVDLAFFLAGTPRDIYCFTSGSLSWHPAASNFSGAGITEDGVPFHYGADWNSAGRWSVEILTSKRKLVLRPLELLQIQKRGSVAIENHAIDDRLDKEFKPGLYRQIQSFLRDDTKRLCRYSDQIKTLDLYMKMANYQ